MVVEAPSGCRKRKRGSSEPRRTVQTLSCNPHSITPPSLVVARSFSSSAAHDSQVQHQYRLPPTPKPPQRQWTHIRLVPPPPPSKRATRTVSSESQGLSAQSSSSSSSYIDYCSSRTQPRWCSTTFQRSSRPDLPQRPLSTSQSSLCRALRPASQAAWA